MDNSKIDQVEQFIPARPPDEIPRDSQVAQIAKNFNPECQQQLVSGSTQTGKSNLLAQFARQYYGRTISYFVTANPWTQQQHNFLFSLCTQMSALVGTNPPPVGSRLDDLKTMVTSLRIHLARQTRHEDASYYFVIDGLEHTLEGVEGDRIIDLLPIETSSRSPYLLTSCRSDLVGRIPGRMRCVIIEPLPFGPHETKMYLADLNLSDVELRLIYDRYHGVPGFLKIIKDSHRTNPKLDISATPKEMERLAAQQVDLVLTALDPAYYSLLEFLAASPAPLPVSLLANLSHQDEQQLQVELLKTGLIGVEKTQKALEFANPVVRGVFERRLGERKHQLVKQVADYLTQYAPDEHFLLTLLLKESQDYEGLQKVLGNQTLMQLAEYTGDVNDIIGRLRVALEMSKDRDDVDKMLRWTLGIAAAKAVGLCDSQGHEIKALISIGDSNKALRRAYAMPDILTRIRLLAKAYAARKYAGERISKGEREELAMMADTLDIRHIDPNLAREVAVDLLPVLPDVAITILERTHGQSRNLDLVELALQSIATDLDEQRESALVSVVKDRTEVPHIAQFVAPWLSKITIEQLLEDLRSVKSTKAKEYLIRQWCRQNTTSKGLPAAIEAWRATVTDDRNFVVPIRSLRQLSDILPNVPIELRVHLVNTLRNTSFAVLDSPREEWVRFRLNLAQTICDQQPEEASSEVDYVCSVIDSEPLDLDVKVFCLARLWAAMKLVLPKDDPSTRKVEKDFNASFYALLSDSAEHFELVRRALQALVDVDPTNALIAASELNIPDRRINGIRVVIGTMLRKHSSIDISQTLQDAFSLLETRERESILVDVLAELQARKTTIAQPNLELLVSLAQQVEDPALKANSLASLAGLSDGAAQTNAPAILTDAIAAWRKEEDLRLRWSLGYEIVDRCSTVDRTTVSAFAQEIDQLQYQPGFALAVGELGVLYCEVLNLIIRALDQGSFNELGGPVSYLEAMISRIPSSKVRAELLAKVASSAYRCSSSQWAEEFIEAKLLPSIKQLTSPAERDSLIEFSLPVIAEYDESTADSLAQNLSFLSRNRAWYSAALWSLLRCILGDQHVDPRKIRIPTTHARLKRLVKLAAKIDYDNLLYGVIVITANAVDVSYDRQLDLMQALEILEQLDTLSDRSLQGSRVSIRHKGYHVIAQSAIHQARSTVFAKDRKQRGWSAKDISKRWQSIAAQADAIPNLADRIFVSAIVAGDMISYYKDERAPSRTLLEKVESLVNQIPGLIDRADRLETIAESWRLIGEKTKAGAVLEQIISLVQQLEGSNAERRASLVVQAAYKISPTFADELAARLDTRQPSLTASPSRMQLDVERLTESPSKLTSLEDQSGDVEVMLGFTARQLLQDSITGRGRVVDSAVLEDWLQRAALLKPEASVRIMHWVVESLRSKRSPQSGCLNVQDLVDVADFVFALANWISPSVREGVPQAVQDSFAGLSSRFEIFRPGEGQRARKWMRNWLENHAKSYLKVCDPYFGPAEFEYLIDVPEGCMVLIMTTDRYFDTKVPDLLKQEIELSWQKLTSRKMPPIQLVIVPRKFEDKFHDRVILTADTGLDVGPSLNLIGESRQKVTLLSKDEATELERRYVDEMLSQATWFMQHSLSPTVVMLGNR